VLQTSTRGMGTGRRVGPSLVPCAPPYYLDMPGRRKAAHKRDTRLGRVDAPAATRQSARARLLEVERESSRANATIARELRSLRADYRKELTKLIGRPAMRDLNAIRAERSRLTRAQRIRRSLAVLKGVSVDRDQIRSVRRPYLLKAQEVLSQAPDIFPHRKPLRGPCESPWVTYTAPFAGYFWSYNWSRSSNPEDPALSRYLDLTTGRIGSRIETKVSSADDDDDLVADYYTSLNVWHTPLATGPIEVYLAFEFTTSTYSGTVRDELGFSNVTHSQFATARMRAADAQDPIQTETQESRIYNHIDFVWGEDGSWSNYVSKPQDLHWYYFKTAATFQQGSSVLLEGGVRHMTWFETDDQSVSTSANLDLRLDRIMIRSCQAEIIL
jgi:hypothetical protein